MAALLGVVDRLCEKENEEARVLAEHEAHHCVA